VDAYVYFYPLVSMDITRKQSTNIEPGKEFKKLATNQLDGQTLASMAVSGRAIFVRSSSHLYCLQQHQSDVSR